MVAPSLQDRRGPIHIMYYQYAKTVPWCSGTAYLTVYEQVRVRSSSGSPEDMATYPAVAHSDNSQSS
jgi:hypothetical protein